MHIELPQYTVVRIWAELILKAAERFEALQHEEAKVALVPWIHSHWVDRCPLPEHRYSRDFQLMFWVRFGDPGFRPPFFHNAGEEDWVRRWLNHRRTMSTVESYLHEYCFQFLPSDWAR